jgi:predicted enzyme related to lactoylglutathione lyase
VIVKLGENEMLINKSIVGRWVVVMYVALALTLGLAVGSLHVTAFAQSPQAAESVSVAVGPQYDTTHVYVAPQDFDRFVASLIATFGGTTTKQGVFTVTPTQSSTMSQLVLTPVGSVSIFGFKTPIPYPFGLERTGYLVTDMDEAVSAAKATGADVSVAPFNDPIGRDAIIQWPGGVNTQLYWHTTAPSYPPLQTVPENRIYVSPDRADAFVRSFLAFSHGTIVSDEARAPGVEIGRPAETYRRVRIESKFGKLTAFVTDGHLPYPYGREMTGYEVTNLAETLAKAKAAGADVLVPPYKTDERDAAVVRFPGSYVAEIHSVTKK